MVGAIDESAWPLRSTEPFGGLADLAAFGRMVDGASVVGLGEATHNSREFFTMKHRVFRYLVREKGFRSFSQEVHVGAGLRINDYVLHGKGDIRRMMNEEFQGGTRLWNTARAAGTRPSDRGPWPWTARPGWTSRRMLAISDVIVGSVAAVTETDSLVIASGSGTQPVMRAAPPRHLDRRGAEGGARP